MILSPHRPQLSSFLEARFQFLSLIAGVSLAIVGALTVASTEKSPATSNAEIRYSAAEMPSLFTEPAPVTYYVVTSALYAGIPEGLADNEYSEIPGNALHYYRIVNSPLAEQQFQEELDWLERGGNRAYQVFDLR
jgi:hypothetical protein